MSSSGRRRRRRPGHRAHHTLRLGVATFDVAATPAYEAPHLLLAEPDSGRDTFITGTLSALLHAGVIALLILFAWLAPDVIEQVIPVQILHDKPGSNEEPAPAPKK